MNELQTWVINLDRAPERLAAHRARSCERLGLPFTRLPAVDARALTAEQRAALDEPAYRRKHGMTPVCGRAGMLPVACRGDARRSWPATPRSRWCSKTTCCCTTACPRCCRA